MNAARRPRVDRLTTHTQYQHEALTRELNRRVVPGAVQDTILGMGEEAVAVLKRILEDPSSTHLQLTNALLLLYRLRGWNREFAADTFIRHCSHRHPLVRQTAVRMLVGAARLALDYPFERTAGLEPQKVREILGRTHVDDSDIQTRELLDGYLRSAPEAWPANNP